MKTTKIVIEDWTHTTATDEAEEAKKNIDECVRDEYSYSVIKNFSGVEYKEYIDAIEDYFGEVSGVEISEVMLSD
jgi:hypothetical protein